MRRLARTLDERRLRAAVAAFFVALALTAAALLWRGYEQSRFEVFYQHRVLAEELAARIEADIRRVVAAEEARGFAEYGFLVVQEPGTGYLARSPLSALPVATGLPGALGYFQVDSAGTLTTPLLPEATGEAGVHGLTDDELAARTALRDRLREILDRPPAHASADGDADVGAGVARPARPLAGKSAGNVFDRLAGAYDARDDATARDELASSVARQLDRKLEQKALSREERRGDAPARAAGRVRSERASRKEQVAVLEAPAAFEPEAVASAPAEAGAAFADLAESTVTAPSAVTPADEGAPMAMDRPAAGFAAPLATEATETADARASVDDARSALLKRAQSSAAPHAVRKDAAPAPSPPVAQPRVRLFESEIDPLSFEVLDDAHFVLFRNVWRAGERYIQGVVVERAAFLDALIGEAWRGTALARASDLTLATRDRVLERWAGEASGDYSARAGALGGELLYRGRLPAPLSALELVFSVSELPPGPGLRLLGWLGTAFSLVLTAGCWAFYRLAAGQLALYRQQQDFVSAVSHELKTPLTSIRMYSEMLKAGWADEDRRQDYYTFIHDESERLSRLIANVLQLARVNRGTAPLETKPQPAGALLDQVRSRVATQAEAAGFTLEVDVDPAARACWVDVDADAFTQVLINLVDNAIKFTPDGARRHVAIACETTRAGEVTVTVRDFGRGIERGQMKRIFELFYRAGNELTRETVGTGIGLALVHELVTRMGGRVDVLNREPGAEFVLSFPACEPPPD